MSELLRSNVLTGVALCAVGLLTGCTLAPGPLPTSRAEAAQRTSVVPFNAVPDCSSATHCPEISVDLAWCSDDPTLYEVTVLGELVVDIRVDNDAVAAKGMIPGAWFGIFPDPTGGCQPAIVTFEVDADGAQ